MGKSECQMIASKLNDARVSDKLLKGSGRNFRYDGKTTLEVMAKAVWNVGDELNEFVFDG